MYPRDSFQQKKKKNLMFSFWAQVLGISLKWNWNWNVIFFFYCHFSSSYVHQNSNFSKPIISSKPQQSTQSLQTIKGRIKHEARSMIPWPLNNKMHINTKIFMIFILRQVVQFLYLNKITTKGQTALVGQLDLNS